MPSELSILSGEAVSTIEGIFPQIAKGLANGAISYGFEGLKKLKHYFVVDKENEIEDNKKFPFAEVYEQFKLAYHIDEEDDSHLFAHIKETENVSSPRYKFKHILPKYDELYDEYANTSTQGTAAGSICKIILQVPELEKEEYNIYKIIYGQIFLSVLSIDQANDDAEKYLQYKKLYDYVDNICNKTRIPKAHLVNLNIIKSKINKYLDNHFLSSLYTYLPTIASDLQNASRNVLVSYKKILDVLLEGQRIRHAVAGLDEMKNGICGQEKSKLLGFDRGLRDVYYTKGNPFNGVFKKIGILIESIDSFDIDHIPEINFPDRENIKQFLIKNIEQDVVLQLLRYSKDKTLYGSKSTEHIEQLTDKICKIKDNLEQLTVYLIVLSKIKHGGKMYNGSILANQKPWLSIKNLISYYEKLFDDIKQWTLKPSVKSTGNSLEEYIDQQNQLVTQKDDDPNKFDIQKKLLQTEFRLILRSAAKVGKSLKMFKVLDEYRGTICENNIGLIHSLNKDLEFTNRLIGRDRQITIKDREELSLTISNFIKGNIITIKTVEDKGLAEHLLNITYKLVLDEIKASLEKYAGPDGHNYTIDLHKKAYSISEKVDTGGHMEKAKIIMDLLLILHSENKDDEKLKNILKMVDKQLKRKLHGTEIYSLLGGIKKSAEIVTRILNVIEPFKPEFQEQAIEYNPGGAVIEEIYPDAEDVSVEAEIKEQIMFQVPTVFVWIKSVLDNAIFYRDIEFLKSLSFLGEEKDQYLGAHKDTIKHKEIVMKVEVLNLIQNNFAHAEPEKANRLSMVVYLQGVLTERYTDDMNGQSFYWLNNFVESIFPEGVSDFLGCATGEKYRLNLVKKELDAQVVKAEESAKAQDTSNNKLREKLSKIIDDKLSQELEQIKEFRPQSNLRSVIDLN